MFEIKNHILYKDGVQVTYKATPNKGGTYKPEFLVMHFTGTPNHKSTLSWFGNPAAKVSAHLLIALDGTVYQFAPFNVVTWHAGQSEFAGYTQLNDNAIGIEIANGGLLKKVDGKFFTRLDNIEIAECDVEEHKGQYWQKYTKEQIAVATQLAILIELNYPIKEVVGHEEIAPGRKIDPGPAFPIELFRKKKYRTTTTLNIRSGPGTSFGLVAPALKPETEVYILLRSGDWANVQVGNISGWVASKYLA